MLTELRIGNFKAFGPTQRVPIRPLTLIFGANSSGKSSIIHSLLLARHIMDGGAPDARTLTGLADSVELGGFRQFVYGQTLDRVVELEMRFALPPPTAEELLRKGAGGETLSSRIRLALSDDADPAQRQPRAVHSILDAADTVLWSRSNWKDEDKRRLLDKLDDGERAPQYQKGEELIQQCLTLQKDGLPSPGIISGKIDVLEVLKSIKAQRDQDLRETTTAYLTETPGSLLPRIPQSEEELRDRLGDDEVNEIQGVTAENYLLRKFLSEAADLFAASLIYLGPLRYRPGRMMAEPDLTDPTWQSGGGVAYWRLQQDAEARAITNDRLRKLGSDYQLEVITWSSREHPDAEKRELVLKDRQGRLLSFGDVGAGISQMLPVLVTAGGAERSVIAIEQPEIHLHPALQAELGDVFIDSALDKRKNTFILETHSEHLILRILRRIRETTEGELPEGVPLIRPEDVAVMYVQPGPEGSEVIELPVTPDGDFDRPWPGGFFAERFDDLP